MNNKNLHNVALHFNSSSAKADRPHVNPANKVCSKYIFKFPSIMHNQCTLTGSLLLLLITFLVEYRKDLGLNAYRRAMKPIIKQVKRKSEHSRTFVCGPGTKKRETFTFSFLITNCNLVLYLTHNSRILNY